MHRRQISEVNLREEEEEVKKEEEEVKKEDEEMKNEEEEGVGKKKNRREADGKKRDGWKTLDHTK